MLVRWVDESFEGRQEWVSPARLKVLWAEVDEFRPREARWDRVRSLGIWDKPLSRPAEFVFEAVDDLSADSPAAPPFSPGSPAALPSALWRVWVLFADCVGVPDLVVVFAVVSNLATAASFGKAPCGGVCLSLGAVMSGSSFCPRTFGAPVT